MKRLLLFIFPAILEARSYLDVISSIQNSLTLKSARQLETAALESYRAAEGKNFPTLDASVTDITFQKTPTVTFAASQLPMGTQKHVEGALTLTYPLFSGFAITSSIDKARLSHEKTVLEVADLKRNLFINATRLYSSIAASDAIISAQMEAKKAIEESYAKARGLYENGLLAPAELYAIEARKYEIDAQIIESQTRKSQSINQLSYLTGDTVDSAHIPADVLPLMEKSEMISIALSHREDLLSLAKAMDIAQSDIALAQSRYYPTIALIGSLKGQGDTLALSGDGYTNANKSYAGVSASWNLFSGLSDYHTDEAAKAVKLSSITTLEDYKQRITTEIGNTYLEIGAVQSRLESAKMQVKASEEYAKLTRGRFDNQLVGADELSRSIADLASAKAKTANLESELFNHSALLWLEAGLNTFEEKIIGTIRK